MGKHWLKGTKLKLCRKNKSRDVMYCMMTRVNTTVLNTGSLLKDFRCSQAHIHKVIM